MENSLQYTISTTKCGDVFKLRANMDILISYHYPNYKFSNELSRPPHCLNLIQQDDLDIMIGSNQILIRIITEPFPLSPVGLFFQQTLPTSFLYASLIGEAHSTADEKGINC